MSVDPKPTIVLVHGAFADASGWSAVYKSLTDLGYPCYAPANPLRGVAADGDYLRSFVSTIEGPVVLVGHSYGGCVITNAGTGAPNVRALVYIAAYAPDEAETLSDAGTLGGGSTELTNHLIARPYPGAPDGDADGYIDPEHFHALFCADIDSELAAFMAASQRGVALSGLIAYRGDRQLARGDDQPPEGEHRPDPVGSLRRPELRRPYSSGSRRTLGASRARRISATSLGSASDRPVRSSIRFRR